MVDPFLPDAEKVAAIRELLPAVGAGIYLDVAAAGPFPAETAHALTEADEWDLRVGRNGPDREADLLVRANEARAVLAAVVGGDPDDIVLTHGPAQALAYAVRAVARGSQSTLLCSSHLAAELRDGLRDSASGSEVRTWTHRAQLDELTVHLTGGIVVMPMVAAATGERLPVAELASDLRRAGWSLVVDASDAVGVYAIDAPELGVSALAFAGDRWLLGPEATGAAWVERQAGRGWRGPWPPASDPLPRRSALGLARSAGWLAMYIGLPWAYERTERLSALLIDGLVRIDGVELVTPRGEAAAIATFRIRGWPLEDAAEELSRRVFAILGRLEANQAMRASVGCWNTDDEIERLLAAVEELARHTPESLPRRPALTILRDPGR